MAGFMAPTWFLSMWISNTATAAMMMPIILEVIEKLKDAKRQQLEMEKVAEKQNIEPFSIEDNFE